MKDIYHAIFLFCLMMLSFKSLACDTEAFGFLLGKPVPLEAKDHVKEIMFSGGHGAGNVIRTYSASVPKPFPDFDNYVYWSNRDKKAVHAITAYRKPVVDKALIYNEAYRQKLADETKLELAKLRKIWEEKYRLMYTAESASELTWRAENSQIRSTIGTYLGEYIYIECENIDLKEKAEIKAWKPF